MQVANCSAVELKGSPHAPTFIKLVRTAWLSDERKGVAEVGG
jgi:hypothetical protein